MILYHGSENIISEPEYSKGNKSNDFGRGFYCTANAEVAGEWACKRKRDGFINKYTIDLDELNICNLNDGTYNILNWLALLTCNRGYWQRKSIAEEAKAFLQTNFLVDLSPFDIVIGNRADDSYFSFAQDFIMGTISLQKLSEAMRLGKLGEQIVLKSRNAFEKISYISNEQAASDFYYPKKTARDMDARRRYSDSRSSGTVTDGIFILDIMRGRVSDDDLRI